MVRFRFGMGAIIAGATGLMVAAAPVWAANLTCKYDSQRRIIEIDYANGWTVTYTYDAAGKRTRTAQHAKKPH